jgi:hypothetical protein
MRASCGGITLNDILGMTFNELVVMWREARLIEK